MRTLSRVVHLARKTNIHCQLPPYRAYSAQFLKSSMPDVELPRDNIFEYVMRDHTKWHNKIAVQCAVTSKSYTYEDVFVKSNNLDKCLRKIVGLQKGDVVALLLPNCPQFIVSGLGVFKAGLRLTTINPMYTADEIQRHIKDCNAKAVITLNDLLSKLQTALENAKIRIPIIVATSTQHESIPNGVVSYEELVNLKIDIPNAEQLNSEDAVFLPYSSGTTGLPKGVMLTNSNVTANMVQYLSFDYFQEANENFQEVQPAMLPMFHIYGFVMGSLAYMKRGTKLVTMPTFSPELYLRVLKEFSPTIMKVAPPIITFLNSHPDVSAKDLQSVRVVMCGAAPLGKVDEDRFRAKVERPVSIVQGYGLTESSTGTGTPLSKEGKYPGTIGELAPNTTAKVVNIDDPDQKHLGPHAVGELLLKGPQVMKGYFNRPEETKNAFTSDGYFRTGDMVRYNEDGMFYMADRIKDLIKVKGFQVAPAELEELIRSYPGVAEAGVIGISNEYSGEVPRAYVVSKLGSAIDVRKLEEYVAAKVAPYKKLVGGVVVVKEIPKNAAGKILRRQLKSAFEKEGV